MGKECLRHVCNSGASRICAARLALHPASLCRPRGPLQPVTYSAAAAAHAAVAVVADHPVGADKELAKEGVVFESLWIEQVAADPLHGRSKLLPCLLGVASEATDFAPSGLEDPSDELPDSSAGADKEDCLA